MPQAAKIAFAIAGATATIGVSPALNSVSRVDEPTLLLNWRWKKLGGDRVLLGALTLE